MKHNLYFLFILCLLPVAVWAQESDEDEDFQTEFTYGVNFNTNGGLFGGLVFRYATAINPSMNHTFGLEVVNVKHPQEIKYQSAEGDGYSFGKENYLFVFRPQYGREKVLFRRAPEEGVRISAIAALGPSIGIIKPYYVSYKTTSGEEYVQYRYDNTLLSTSTITGTGGLHRFNGTQIGMGIHAKIGLGFEIGGFRSSATGFEVGTLVEAFTKKIRIMSDPETESRSVFTSVYLNIFFKSKK